jgi:hypothetical protein
LPPQDNEEDRSDDGEDRSDDGEGPAQVSWEQQDQASTMPEDRQAHEKAKEKEKEKDKANRNEVENRKDREKSSRLRAEFAERCATEGYQRMARSRAELPINKVRQEVLSHLARCDALVVSVPSEYGHFYQYCMHVVPLIIIIVYPINKVRQEVLSHLARCDALVVSDTPEYDYFINIVLRMHIICLLIIILYPHYMHM